MVNFTLHTIAALTLSACVAAIHGARTTSTTPFTFAQWVEDIIADPNGDHLSPEEAVMAKNAAVAATPIEKRANCEQSWPRANADDAAKCVQHLASLGADDVNCGIGENEFSIQMCDLGDARIVSSKATSPAEGANCNDVARTGGLIFDSCWRSDGTVTGSENCISNSLFQINILGI